MVFSPLFIDLKLYGLNPVIELRGKKSFLTVNISEYSIKLEEKRPKVLKQIS